MNVRIFVLWTSVIVANSKSNDLIVDVSQECVNNFNTSIYLLYGTGPTDSRVVLMHTVSTLVRTCSFLIVGPHHGSNCNDQCSVIFVVEFFHYNKSNSTFLNLEGGIYIRTEDKHLSNVLDINGRPLNKRLENIMQTYIVYTKNFFVDINYTGFSGTMKITVTAAKHLHNYENCTMNETLCVLDGQLFCIDKHLECDGNLNCGTPHLYDEYCKTIEVGENVLFTVIYGICLIAVIMFFIIQILRYCVPTVADHFFVFNEDEEYNFVLTSQTLPPLEATNQDLQNHKLTKATDTEII